MVAENKKKKQGPYKLNPTTTRKFSDALGNGSTFETASALCGITPAVARIWIRRGAREYTRRVKGLKKYPGEDLHVEFYKAVSQALAKCENELVKTIKEAKHWKASAFLLERRFPRQWGARAAMKETMWGELAEQILDSVQDHVDDETFEKLTQILSAEYSDSRDRK